MQPQPDVAPEELESAKSYGQKMVLCVREDGMHILFAELLRAADNSSASFRTSAVTLLGTYCAESKVDFRPHVPMTLKKLIELLNDPAVEVQKAAWSALDSLMKAIEKNEQPGFVADVRLYLSYVRDDLRKQGKTALPGLCLPKGLDAILPLFLQGTYTVVSCVSCRVVSCRSGGLTRALLLCAHSCRSHVRQPRAEGGVCAGYGRPDRADHAAGSRSLRHQDHRSAHSYHWRPLPAQGQARHPAHPLVRVPISRSTFLSSTLSDAHPVYHVFIFFFFFFFKRTGCCWTGAVRCSSLSCRSCRRRL